MPSFKTQGTRTDASHYSRQMHHAIQPFDPVASSSNSAHNYSKKKTNKQNPNQTKKALSHRDAVYLVGDLKERGSGG